MRAAGEPLQGRGGVSASCTEAGNMSLTSSQTSANSMTPYWAWATASLVSLASDEMHGDGIGVESLTKRTPLTIRIPGRIPGSAAALGLVA